MRPYPSLTDLVAPSAPNYQPVRVNSSRDPYLSGFPKFEPRGQYQALDP